MRIESIVPLFEFKTDESRKLGHVINAAKKAVNSLSYDARRAVKEWQSSNWDTGTLQRSHINKDEIFQEIEAAFAPVKATLKAMFGDTIRLHRGQRTFKDGEYSSDERPLFSFSFDEQVAKDFAHGKLDRESSQEEIDDAVERYERTGFTTFRGKKFKKNTTYPNFFDIYDKRNNYITDGDDIRKTLTSMAADATDYNSERRERGKVYTIDVPIDKIFWVTNDLGSKEFIVALNPLKN